MVVRVAWMRMMGVDSVEYHEHTVAGRGDDPVASAAAYYAVRGETPMVWGGRGRGLLGLDGEVDEFFRLFAEEDGPVVLGVGEGVLEIEKIATPVIDGVAMDAGLFCRGGHGCAAGQGANDGELLRGKSVIAHRLHFLFSG